jgi:hypothetical protein
LGSSVYQICTTECSPPEPATLESHSRSTDSVTYFGNNGFSCSRSVHFYPDSAGWVRQQSGASVTVSA